MAFGEHTEFGPRVETTGAVPEGSTTLGVAPEPRGHAAAEQLAAELAPTLRRSGVPAVLALLNARTRYRFTGVYRVETPLLRNVHLYDRENPSLALSGDINTLEDTYCSLVVAASAPFGTRDGSADRRAGSLAGRSPVVSYLGVPIRGADGRVYGTLCHFDCRPRLVPEGEEALLGWVASLLGASMLDAAAERVAPR